MAMLDELWRTGEDLLSRNLRDTLTISGMWRTRLWLRPAMNELLYKAEYLVTIAGHQGCAFHDDTLEDEELSELVGAHYTAAVTAHPAVRVAVADAIFGHSRGKIPASVKTARRGTPGEKAHWRAAIVAREVSRLLPVGSRGPVALVGVSRLIAMALAERDIEVIPFDLNPLVVGSLLYDSVRVLHGTEFFQKSESCCAAVVTGMTMVNLSLESILKTCVRSKISALVYAQTAANMAPWYLYYGAQAVVAERMPFYNFEGYSEIEVYRASINSQARGSTAPGFPASGLGGPTQDR